MPEQPYIIWAPPYVHCSAGTRVLHKLGHLLNEAGEKAFIYKNKTNPKWNVPTISPREARTMIKQGAIVVYPEIVSGNPLRGSSVVRYILNNPGLIGGDKTYAPTELLFVFSKTLLQPGMSQDRVLNIPTTDTGVFYDDSRERDIEYLVYFGKYKKKVKGYPPDRIIYPYKPKKPEQLGELLRRCKKLISYDDYSALVFEATLCGCPVVVIPDGFRKKEDLEKGEVGLNGVAWGDSEAEMAKARVTLPKAKEVLSKLERDLGPSLRNFIEITQKYADEVERPR